MEFCNNPSEFKISLKNSNMILSSSSFFWSFLAIYHNKRDRYRTWCFWERIKTICIYDPLEYLYKMYCRVDKTHLDSSKIRCSIYGAHGLVNEVMGLNSIFWTNQLLFGFVLVYYVSFENLKSSRSGAPLILGSTCFSQIHQAIYTSVLIRKTTYSG